ncbi:MAG: hypothetical protein JO337_11060 [Acidimicrobiales bacterium]|nr:hypothetical protein [Acidimicrobiales bacterium]
MPEEEELVAEQVVAIAQSHTLTVRISQHAAEEFWRVDVSNPSIPSRSMTTTVAPGDSFMMNLINGAVSGEQLAWRHLAHWGRDALSRPAQAPRRRFA